MHHDALCRCSATRSTTSPMLATRSIFGRTSDAFSVGAPPLASAPQPVFPFPRPALVPPPQAFLLLPLHSLILPVLVLVRPFSVSPFFLLQALSRRPPAYRPTR